MEKSTFREDILWEIITTIKDVQDLERFKENLSAAASTKVAVYFDEIEELVRAQDSAKPKTKTRAIRKPSR